jgi:hypothetical protein
MRPEDFTVDVARKVMLLWKEHLGFWREHNHYMEHPEILASRLQKPSEWHGTFQDRVGSKYTDDSKLRACLKDGELEISCYAQSHVVFGKKEKQEAEKAQNDFNTAVMKYISNLG